VIRPDHVKHFFVCFIITALGTIPWQIWHAGWMLALPMVLGLCAGFYKELDDRVATGFDWTDILADVVGIGIAMALYGIAVAIRWVVTG
jgi:hypothetical protein